MGADADYVDRLPFMIAVYDADQRLEYANAPYAQYRSRRGASPIGRKISDILGADAYAMEKPYLEAAYRGRESVLETWFDGDDGTPWYGAARFHPIVEDGQVTRVMVVLEDRTDKRRIADALIRTREELFDARDLADAANRTRSNFFANLSHELRTPLNAIIGFSELINDGIDPGSEHERATIREYMRFINASGRQLLGLIDGLLNLAEIDGRGLVLSRRMQAMGPIVRDAMQFVEPIAATNHVALRFDSGADAPAAHPRTADVQAADAQATGAETADAEAADARTGDARDAQAADARAYVDERAAKQLVVNLLGAALRASRAGGVVTVLLTPIPDGAKIEVTSDAPATGCGARRLARAIVAGAPSSMSASLADSGEANGFSLAIIRELVKAHAGQLTVDPPSSAGMRIRVTLPAFHNDVENEVDADADDAATMRGNARCNAA